jgi:hypothetical protein
MSIAGIFGSSVLSLLFPGTQTPLHKTKQEFQQLGQDLKSGNLSAAQSDITALQQNVAQRSASASTTVPISASQTGSAISQDFAKLSTDLKSGNLTAAQPITLHWYKPFKAKVRRARFQATIITTMQEEATPMTRLPVRQAPLPAVPPTPREAPLSCLPN